MGRSTGFIAAAALLTAWGPGVPSALAKRSLPTPVTAIGSPGDWITTEDYPAIALRSGEQGTTAFTLTVNEAGHVSNCAITSTSGSAALDQATCELVTRRANFTPATGTSGKPIIGTYTSRVLWTLPKQSGGDAQIAALLLQPNDLSVSFLVTKTGQVTDCVIERATGPLATKLMMETKGKTPDELCDFAKVSPLRDASGDPVDRRFRMTFKVEPVPDAVKR